MGYVSMRRFKIITWGIFPLLVTTLISNLVAVAQEPTCSAIIETAWTAIEDLCAGTGRQQACYGHEAITFQPQPGFNAALFEQPGDIIDLMTIQSLRFSALDLATGQWGVAQMRLQADIPVANGENVTMLVFGNVDIQNAVPAPTPVAVNVTVANTINIRLTPTTGAPIVATLAPGTTVTARARLADSSWLQIEVPETGEVGWVYAALVSAPADELAGLNVATSSAPYYGPMQAFYFSSGTESPVCDEMPPDGLLIQTPEGVAEVSLLINEVNIQIGSTAFLTAESGESMAIRVVEGKVTAQTAEGRSTAIAGTQISIPLDDNLSPTAPPTMPTAYETNVVARLPVTQLERPIDIAAPFDINNFAAISVVCANDTSGALDRDCVTHWERHLNDLIDVCFDASAANLDPACVDNVMTEEDFDQDGVPNLRDNCPARSGPAANNGCPVGNQADGTILPPINVPGDTGDCAAASGDCRNDSDSDGIPDDIDTCPLVMGPAANRGCPVTTPGGDGNPVPTPDPCADPNSTGDPACARDSDGDGIIDANDVCPLVAGSAAASGCPLIVPPTPDNSNGSSDPDRDGDGVPNEVDNCPDVPGPLINAGCPIN